MSKLLEMANIILDDEEGIASVAVEDITDRVNVTDVIPAEAILAVSTNTEEL
jgi:hypothetical protein